jgi:hypothetical protein
MRKNQDLLNLRKKYGFLSNKKSMNISSDTLETFMSEIEEMINNYEKELEKYKTSSQQNESVCEKCENMKNELSAMDKEISRLNEENRKLQKLQAAKHELSISNAVDICIECSKTVESVWPNEVLTAVKNSELNIISVAPSFNNNDSLDNKDIGDSYIMLKKPDNSNIIENDNEYNKGWMIEVLSSSIYQGFINSISINHEAINNKALNNIQSYVSTIFINEGTMLSFSIVHEYLQDLFLQIYQVYLENMNIEKQYNWVISEEDIKSKDNIIEKIVDKALLNNPINLLHRGGGFDIEAQIKKLLNGNFEELKDRVKQIVEERINQYFLDLREDVKKLVLACIKYIHAGKIINRNHLTYDFWKLYFDYNSLIKRDKITYYYQSMEGPECVDNFISYLKYEPEIEELKIQGNLELANEFIFPLKVVSIPLITGLKSLKTLGIVNTKLTEDSNMILLQMVLEVTQITHLDLSNNNIEDKGIRCLMEALKLNECIKVINLSYNNITANGGFYISDMLVKNRCIESLILTGNNITENGLQSLISVLIENNRILKSLNLSSNKLKLIDILYVNNLIAKNTQLEVLDISDNPIDIDSITNLGFSLRENNTLKILKMNNIGLTEESAPYFLQYLMNSKIENLSMDLNYFGEIGGILFANVIKFNNYLKQVSLKKTQINSNALMCISRALETVESSIEIDISENQFDDDSILLLSDTIKDKNIKIKISQNLLTQNGKNIVANNQNFII